MLLDGIFPVGRFLATKGAMAVLKKTLVNMRNEDGPTGASPQLIYRGRGGGQPCTRQFLKCKKNVHTDSEINFEGNSSEREARARKIRPF